MTEPNPTERGAQVRFPPPLVFLGFILLGVALQYAVTPIPFPVARWITLSAGILVLLTGLGIGLMARSHFVRTGQKPTPWTPSPELLLEGPYRFTRNPMYVGVTCFQVGLGLALNNLWISLFAPLSLLAVHFIAVLPEEKYLTEKFGADYKAYLRTVRRYL
jgi:protein-S-isoprenylcysteine O-methyltransferase Ste14